MACKACEARRKKLVDWWRDVKGPARVYGYTPRPVEGPIKPPPRKP